MARIHKRRTGSGELVWELTHGTGSDRQRFIAGRSREEAEEVLKQFNRQLALHGDAPKDGTIAEVMGEYAAYLKVNRRRRTMNRYTRVLRTFHDCFLSRFHPEVQRLQQLRPAHIEEFKAMRLEGRITEFKNPEEFAREEQLRAQLTTGLKARSRKDNAKFGWLGRHSIRAHVSRRTVNYELQTLSTFFRWAIAHNRLFLNPAQTVERLRLPKRAVPKFIVAEDLKKFFAACSEPERRLFLSILLSGMREGEVSYLTWPDVSFDLGVIFIQAKPELEWQPKTDERLIPMSPMLREVLLMQHATRTSDLFVFPNEAGQRETHMLAKLKRVCRRAGIPPSTVHALRHSFGAHLRMAGASLADIADLMGHKDLATTQIYAKVHQEHLRGVISKLAPLANSIEDSPKKQHSDTAPQLREQPEQKLLTE